MAVKGLLPEEKQNISDAIALLRRVAEAKLKQPARGYVSLLLNTIQGFFL